MINKSAFETFWDSNDNPARNMPTKTREQIKWHARQFFNAGRRVEDPWFQEEEDDFAF